MFIIPVPANGDAAAPVPSLPFPTFHRSDDDERLFIVFNTPALNSLSARS